MQIGVRNTHCKTALSPQDPTAYDYFGPFVCMHTARESVAGDRRWGGGVHERLNK